MEGGCVSWTSASMVGKEKRDNQAAQERNLVSYEGVRLEGREVLRISAVVGTYLRYNHSVQK
jgi:hypothetical protein